MKPARLIVLSIALAAGGIAAFMAGRSGVATMTQMSANTATT